MPHSPVLRIRLNPSPRARTPALLELVASGRGSLQFALGAPERRTRLFKHGLDWSRVIVAWREDQPVGYAQVRYGGRGPYHPGLQRFIEEYGWGRGLWAALAFYLAELKSWRSQFYLYGLRVLPQYRRQGIGAALVREVLSLAQSLGYEYVDLDVGVNFHAAKWLYIRCGFSELRSSRLFGLTLLLPFPFPALCLMRCAIPKRPKTVLITGATGGIGSALAKEYAEPGNTLILQGRNAARLAEMAARFEAQGVRVLTCVLDLRNREAFSAWLQGIAQQERLDLVIANAGVNNNIGADGKGEKWEDIQALIEVNLLAAMATVDAVLPSMRERGHGQIALMSSLIAYFGLPMTPSYSASKAALKAYGEALRGWLQPEGIRVNVIMPGYVRSPMCDAMPGPKPFLWSPERAAKVIRRGLEHNKARISFPFPLNLGTWFLAVLPASISTRIVQLMGFRG